MQRIIELEGAFNVRDLGGLPTTDGYEVRYGKLFRSDALGRLTDQDMALMERYGISTVLDLRTDDEIAEHGVARLIDNGARHVHIRLMEQDPGEPLPSHPSRTLGELYSYMARKGPDKFVETITFLGETGNMPAVFHCAAGKDRTGITAALVYSVLGVDREDIIRDYVITEEAMQRVIARLSLSEQAREGTRQVHSSYLHAEDETLRTFLTWLDEAYGSPVQWLLDSGMQTNVIDNLKREMLG
ncbi:MAG: tyrosine-protein phosphatase [Thermomicrobiales bacterium]|nr:tyrosine-protein phosphatase [Thermomicrobiales bacterium]MCO5218630.1 tyrosine-protein phosphatase [Thermomicrobiales bacterium]MCO5224307.1 tyrosine-protein phosphatase [Thermomicrobiales bacterium]MCO5229382.1 tyrosine-protein phosphatase [Thermomicrobiales bacterium]